MGHGLTDIRQRYEQDGYVVLEGVFSPGEAADLKVEIRRLLGLSGGPPSESIGPHALEGFHQHGVFVGLSANSAVFQEAARRDAIVAALVEILSDHVIFLSDKVVAKDAAMDFGSPWHQDWPYWRGSHKVSAWIALDPATKENGCLRVVSGSHRRGELAHAGAVDDGRGFDNRLAPDQLDESEAVALEVGAGDAVLFHDLLFHASYPNASGQDRWALISTYKDGHHEDPDYPWASAAFTVAEPRPR